MKNTMKRLATASALCILALMASAAFAHAAGQVTVIYQTFPSGPVLDSNVVTGGCETATADTFPNYLFIFWDTQGSISWSPTVTICPGSGKSTATAWYLATGGCPGGTCGCPPSGCYVTTFAFSIDHNKVLAKGTAIASVAPNSPLVWISPMTTVLTNSAENITANSSMAFAPFKSEPFRYWQELGTTKQTPLGSVYQAGANDTAWVVAFYGPDPCDFIRGEVQSCVEEGHLNCSGLIKGLELCEAQNREP